MRYLLISLALLSGCASVSTVYGPDGKEYKNVACDGASVPMKVCYDKAMEICPQGYYMVARDVSTGPLVAVATTQAATMSQSQNKSITISCK